MPIFFTTPTFARPGVVASFVLTPPGSNLVFNPFFESGIGWTWVNAYLDTSFYEPIDFCHSSIRLNLNTPTAYVSETTPHPVTPGQVYELAVDVFSTGWPGEQNTPPTTMPASWTNTGISGPHEPTGTMELQGQFWDATGLTLISTVTVASQTPTGGLWVTTGGSVTVPAGAAGMTILIVLSGETEQDWWLDNVQLELSGNAFVPDITIGVLFAQGTMYAPSLPPTLPAAPAPSGGALSRQSWLWYNSSTGFYWNSSATTPTTSGDASLGWAVTNATGIAALSNRQLGTGLPEVVTPIGPVTAALVPPAPNVASATAAVAIVVVGGANYYQFSGTFVNAADTTNVGQVAAVMENITGAEVDVPIATFVAPLVAGATVNWVSAPIPLPTSGGVMTFTPAFRSSNLIGAVTSPELDLSNLTVTPAAPPAAPNITLATATVNYTSIAGVYYWYLTGTITLPSSPAAIASIAVDVVGIDPTATIVNAPSGGWGSTVAYRTPMFRLPLAAELVTIDFPVGNSAGAVSASPYSQTAYVQPSVITSIAIAEVSGARQIVPGNQSTSVAVTPTFGNSNGVQQLTFWYSRDGGSTLYLIGSYQYAPGAAAIDIGVSIVSTALSGGLSASNWILYAAPGAWSSPGSPAAGISYATLLAAFPSVVTSNAITILPGAPLTNGALWVATNAAGSTPTASNIYMGFNSLGNPWAQVNFTIQTPGGGNSGDPNAYQYQIWVAWTDASGNLINPGGVSNNPGWILLEGGMLNVSPNSSGSVYNVSDWINYPAPGVTAYLTFRVYGLNQDLGLIGSGTSPLPFYPSGVLQGYNGGATQYFRIGPLSPPVGTLTGQNLSNVKSLANSVGATSTATQSPAVSMLPDGNFAYDALGVLGGGGPSQWGYSGASGSLEVMNDGVGSSTAGVQNYLRVTTSGGQIYTNVIVPTNQALYFAFAARSNNPTVSIVTEAAQTGTATGCTNGTYTGVPLNGAGGTGATCTITVVGNVITSLGITAGGSGYAPNTNFTVPVTAAGGSGLQVKAYTGVHEVQLTVTAYDSNNNVVNVGGSASNSVTVSGYASAWEITAATMILTFPANVAFIHLACGPVAQEPVAGTWDVTNFIVETVANLLTSGQTNTQVPQTQPTAVSVMAAESISTAQASYYGLAYLQLIGTASESFNVNISPGAYASMQVSADGGNVSVGASANNTPASGAEFLLAVGSNQVNIIVTSTGIELQFNGSTPAVTINGSTGFTGAVAGRSSKAGWVV